MEEFNTLSSSLTGSIILISLILKVMDYQIIAAWLTKTMTTLPDSVPKALLIIWMLFEFLLSALITWKGPTNESLVIYILAFFVTSSIVAWFFFKKKGGCPCFGTASLSGEINSLKVFGLLSITLFILYVSASPLEANASYCLIITISSTFMFFWGRHVILTPNSGKIVQYPIERTLDEHGIKASKSILLFFIKKRCPSCIKIMQYVEKISKVFCSEIIFILIIDEFHIEEAAKLGEAIVLPDNNGHLKKACKIKAMPSLISLHSGIQSKYSGLNACNLGMSKVLCS